jgi:hypothetical protein
LVLRGHAMTHRAVEVVLGHPVACLDLFFDFGHHQSFLSPDRSLLS